MSAAGRTARGWAALLLLATGLAPLTPARADDSVLPSVKAAFVFNFIKLTQWPPQRLGASGSPFRVCVLSGDPMETPLRDTLAGKAIGDRPIDVVTTALGVDHSDCHLLYLGGSLRARYAVLMQEVAGRGVLVVDEGEAFTWPDGMIRLFVEENRMRFELNLPAIERAGLKVDPRLIRLAKIASR